MWNSIADFEHELIYAVARDITARKQAEEERERLLRELQVALAEVKELQRILPICMYCKSIRDDENYWQTVEVYISHHTSTRFSHGICPACYDKVSELGWMRGNEDAWRVAPHTPSAAQNPLRLRVVSNRMGRRPLADLIQRDRADHAVGDAKL